MKLIVDICPLFLSGGLIDLSFEASLVQSRQRMPCSLLTILYHLLSSGPKRIRGSWGPELICGSRVCYCARTWLSHAEAF